MQHSPNANSCAHSGRRDRVLWRERCMPGRRCCSHPCSHPIMSAGVEREDRCCGRKPPRSRRRFAWRCPVFAWVLSTRPFVWPGQIHTTLRRPVRSECVENGVWMELQFFCAFFNDWRKTLIIWQVVIKYASINGHYQLSFITHDVDVSAKKVDHVGLHRCYRLWTPYSQTVSGHKSLTKTGSMQV